MDKFWKIQSRRGFIPIRLWIRHWLRNVSFIALD